MMNCSEIYVNIMQKADNIEIIVCNTSNVLMKIKQHTVR